MVLATSALPYFHENFSNFRSFIRLCGTEDIFNSVFTCFPSLPAELRLQIWRLVLGVPQVVSLIVSYTRAWKGNISLQLKHPASLRFTHKRLHQNVEKRNDNVLNSHRSFDFSIYGRRRRILR